MPTPSDLAVNNVVTGRCRFRRLGTVEYKSARALQQQLAGARSANHSPDTLLLLEHPPTYTLGYNSNSKNVLASSQWIEENDIAVHNVDRGGDVTFHGPGQLIGYPVIQLAKGPREAVLYIRRLEEMLISVLKCWGIMGTRFKKPGGHGFYTGVWVAGEKIAAIGIKVDANQVTHHGFALNVHTDLSYFNKIIPCGIQGKTVTSLSRILGKQVAMAEVMDRVEWAFQGVFDVEPI
jgi:lipoyl(octanoyl) transferase